MKRDNRIKKYSSVIIETYIQLANLSNTLTKQRLYSIIIYLQKIAYYKARICCLKERKFDDSIDILNEVFELE